MMKATPQQAVDVASVFWDIKTCPIPPGCDPGLVGPCIKLYLKKLGYTGPLTISVVGLLTDVPVDVLRALSSTGILLSHVPFGSISILETMQEWLDSYPPPASMMIISFNPSIFPQISQCSEYNIFELFPYDSPNPESLWKNFILDAAPKVDKCSGTDESATWFCSVCNIPGIGFENFATHLSCQEHKKEATQLDKESVAVTLVLWDIKSYPVPPDCNPQLVTPCIKQYLKYLGYSGPLIISAVGILTDVPADVLRALSFSGILLRHVHSGSVGILETIYEWFDSYKPPANMMIISSNPSIFPQIQEFSEYNIFELFPYDSPNPESLWNNFILDAAPKVDMCSVTDESASWFCSVCNITHIGFENLTTHLSGQQHKEESIQLDKESVAVTLVLWDIKGCPVPPDCNPRRVAPCIKQYLKDLGYSGPLTIRAIGQLKDYPDDILQAVSSSGIVLNQCDVFNSVDIMHVINSLTNPISPPANMMFICPFSKDFTSVVTHLRYGLGYNIIEPFPHGSPYSESLWKSFLDSGTLEEEDCCGIDESASWFCSVCNIAGKGFEKFTTHLSSQEHKEEATQMRKKPVAVTSVLWDIKSCSVPPGFNARRVAPCIKKYMEGLGYGGPLTISAIGQLKDVSNDVLRAVSSTGIVLNQYDAFNSGSLLPYLYLWSCSNLPPANILVLFPYSEDLPEAVGSLQKMGYNIINPFPYDYSYSKSVWDNIRLQNSGTLAEDECSENDELASWVCSVCCRFGNGFEDFIMHLSREVHKQKPTHLIDMEATSVFWDIKSFPVPPDCDGRLIAQIIITYLEASGYSGPLTINAIGLLTDISDDVLRAVSSTGIVLNHVAFNSVDIMGVINSWADSNPPPANMLFLCPFSEAFAKIFSRLQELGYNIIGQPFTPANLESLWQSYILEDSVTVEDASWFCSVCDITDKGFENFTMHFSSQDHKQKFCLRTFDAHVSFSAGSAFGFQATKSKVYTKITFLK